MPKSYNTPAENIRWNGLRSGLTSGATKDAEIADYFLYEYRIEPLKCDRDALKQECRLARIACKGTQPPTHLSEKIQRARSYYPRVSSAIGTKRKLRGETGIPGILRETASSAAPATGWPYLFFWPTSTKPRARK